MYKFEKTRREVQHQSFNQNDAKYPSFSSTLLDQIYRSIDEGEDTNCPDMKKNNNFYTAETTTKKQITRTNAKFHRTVEEEEANIRRAWKSSEKVRKSQHEQDQDVQFFSSTSSSSDSSGLLSSSSDTESVYGVKSRSRSRASCFAPSKPKPVKTSVAVAAERRIASEEDGLIKSKSRAVKIYDNLKKVKQPISPGGKLTSFLNSLFTNTKKTKTGEEDVNAERKVKSSGSTCSSASSFSRSCLSKKSSSSSSSKDIKRTVRFYPVSVILDEDSRPCGHKCLYEKKEEETAVKIGRLAVKKKEEEEEVIMEKSRRVEEAAREFLREYRRNHHKILTEFPIRKMEEDEDDDVSSCCSSDLFELDHLSVMGGDRKKYCEELPVYETTNFTTNRAIAKGLIM